jgi:hypothetical protein
MRLAIANAKDGTREISLQLLCDVTSPVTLSF